MIGVDIVTVEVLDGMDFSIKKQQLKTGVYMHLDGPALSPSPSPSYTSLPSPSPSSSSSSRHFSSKQDVGSDLTFQMPRGPVFGLHIDALMQLQGVGYIPYMVARAILFLWGRMDVEDLFQIETDVTVMNQLVDMYNEDHSLILEDVTTDPILVANLLKKFFQDLPEPILTFDLYDDFLRTDTFSKQSDAIAWIKKLCKTLPVANYALLDTFFSFLHFYVFPRRGPQKGDILGKLASALGPCMMRMRGGASEMLLDHLPKMTMVLCYLIQFYEDIFGVTTISSIEVGYEVKEILGSGAYGIVRRVVDREKKVEFAMKSINLSKANKKQLENLKNEIAVLKFIRHPNTIQLFEICETPTDLHLIVEYVRGGELMVEIAKRKTFSEGDACSVVFQLLNALDYLHKMNVVHRGVCPGFSVPIRMQLNQLISSHLSNSLSQTSNLKMCC